MGVVSTELKAKRAELSDEVRQLNARMADLQEQITTVAEVITICEPDWRPEELQRTRRGRPPKAESVKELDKLIGGTNKRQMTLDILRTARRPLSPPNARRNSP